MVKISSGKNSPFRFQPKVVDSNFGDKRRIIKHLPAVHQTENLQKFFGSTVDHLFEPGNSETNNGFIGRKPLWYKSDEDYYIEEINKERSFYQLESSMVSKSLEGDVTNVLFYNDLVNHLRFQGANVENHNRLFSETYYNWLPPIDIDKLMNFRQYVWLPLSEMVEYDEENNPVGNYSIEVYGPTSMYEADGFQKDFYLPGFDSNDPNVESEYVDLTLINKNRLSVFVDGRRVPNDEFSISSNKKFITFQFAPPAESIVELIAYSDVEEYVIGKKNVSSDALGGHLLSNGQRVKFFNDRNSDFYNNKTFIVEGVGSSIFLIEEKEEHFNSIEPDYIVMERGAANSNPWSIANRWFHIDTISDKFKTSYINSKRASRPILEYKRNIELLNYGNYRRASVDMVQYDIEDFNAYMNDNTTSIVIDGQTVTVKPSNKVSLNGGSPIDAVRVLIINTNNDLMNNKIYAIVNESGTLQFKIETDGQNPLGDPSLNEIVFIKNGYMSGGDIFWNGNEWQYSQRKDGINLDPKFNLYDSNGISLSDKFTYNLTTFDGSTLFSYKLDDSGYTIDDKILNRPLVHDNKGQILFESTLETNRYHYYIDNDKIEINGSYYFKINDGINEKLLNNWYESSVQTKQYVVDNYVYNGGAKVFKISQEPENNDIVVKIGRSTGSSYEEIDLKENVDYIRYGREIYIFDIKNGDNVEVKTFSNKPLPNDATGYFEVPVNLQANPTNGSVDFVAKGDFYAHFESIMLNQDGFTGVVYERNNWRDTTQTPSKGGKIIRNKASLLKTMLLASDNNLDITTVIRYVESEYSRFKDKFHQKVFDLSNSNRMKSSDTIDTWINAALNDINKGKTKQFPFYNSMMARVQSNEAPTFIPPTPSFFGINGIYEPEYSIQNELNENDELVEVHYIKCHDGSWMVAKNNICATIIYELETRIYNSALVNIKSRLKPVLNIKDFHGDHFRSGMYSHEEYMKILQPFFERWTVSKNVDYTINDIYDASDPLSWNWSSVKAYDGSSLPGHWRGIFEKFYGTQRPDLTPWEMLGFTNKPDWWEDRYGPAPYTETNILLWEDVEKGYIAEGDFAGYNDSYARPGISNLIPVGPDGEIKTPYEIGIAVEEPMPQDAKKDWSWGDLGPVEQEWRRSSSYFFALAQVLYLMRPADFVETYWDINPLEFDHDLVHGEFDEDNNVVIRQGIQQWISEYVTSNGSDISKQFGNKIRGLNAQLAYKVGGFIENETLVAISDSFGRIPSDDISVSLYKSPSIREEVYSGVIIEYTKRGYKVHGYDNLNPYFRTIKEDENGNKIRIGSTGRVVNVPSWRPETYYTANVTVKYGENYFKCLKSHTSSSSFENQFWLEVLRPQTANELGMVWYLDNDKNNQIKDYTYGSIMPSMQDIATFISGYSRYLTSRGWVFEHTLDDGITTIDWKSSLNVFINWARDNRKEGDVLFLSPGSTKIKYVSTHGTVQPVEQIVNGVYSIIDQFGKPIWINDTTVVRHEDEISIVSTSDDKAIHCLRLHLSEIEHIIVFNNKTIFNDVIYSPLLNVHQKRLRLQSFKTQNWKGRIDAPGFIITENSLIPNFEKSADDFRYFYSIENNGSKKMQDHARANLGYEEKEYMNNLLMGSTNQFEFYQGMIQQKGTPTSMKRILRSSFIRHNKNLGLFEEWAFRLNDFGGSDINNSLSITINQEEFKHNPQLIVFKTRTSGNDGSPPTTNDSLTLDNAINVEDIFYDGGDYELDEHWSWRPLDKDIRWSMGSYDDLVKTNLLSGHVKLDEVQWTVRNKAELDVLLYNQSQTSEGITAKHGDRVWVYGIGDSDWMTYRLNKSTIQIDSVTEAELENQGSLIVLNSCVNLDDTVGNAGCNPNIIRDMPLVFENFYMVIPNKPEYRKTQLDDGTRVEEIIFGTGDASIVGKTLTPLYRNSASFDINGNGLMHLMNLNSKAKMFIKSITVDVLEPYEYGSTLNVGTNIDDDRFIRGYVYDIDAINFDQPEERVIVAERDFYEIDDNATLMPIQIVRVGPTMNLCSPTVATVQYRVSGMSGWQSICTNWPSPPPVDELGNPIICVGNSFTFEREFDQDSNDYSHYIQTIYIPVTNMAAQQNVEIRIVTNGDPSTESISNLNVVRYSSGWTNSVDLTKIGSKTFGPNLPHVYPYYVEDLENELTATINNVGTSGRIKISVEYFYVQGFELGIIENGKIVPYNVSVPNTQDEIVLGDVYTWVPTKFENTPVVNYDLYDNDTIFEVVTSNSFYTMKHDSITLRTKNKRINSHDIESAEIYNAKDDSLMLVLQVYDPIKGIIPGIADRELAYKQSNDPAIYNTTPYSDDAFVWGKNQVGKLWWDQSTIRYLDYEITDNDPKNATLYRWKNWGRIAPGLTIDVYEWIRTTVHPLEWDNYVSSMSDITIDGGNKPSGTAKIDDIANPKFSTHIEWNDELQRNETVYYYWVKDVTTLPAIDERNLTARQVANIITNPINNDIPLISVIDHNKVIISGIKQFLNDGETILKIKWKEKSEIQVPHHKQWILVREGDEAENIPNTLWNKMRDSLVGWDDYVPETFLTQKFDQGSTSMYVDNAWDMPDKGTILIGNELFDYNSITRSIGLIEDITPSPSIDYPEFTVVKLNNTQPRQIPDKRLPQKQQVGNLNRPRQSWFNTEPDGSPSREARSIFFEALNNIISRNPVMDQWFEINNFLENGEELPDSDRYIASVDTLEDLDLLLVSGVNPLNEGDRVLIETTKELLGLWTLWELFDDGYERNFKLVDFQKWRLQEGELWDRVDWYKSGYSKTDTPQYFFRDVNEKEMFGAIDTTLYDGTLIQYNNMFGEDGRWYWDVDNGSTIERVAIMNGTFKFKDNFFDAGNIPFNMEVVRNILSETITPNMLVDSLWDTMKYRDGSLELKHIVETFKESFISDAEKNELFFTMVRHAVARNNVDWVFKTSFLYFGGYSEELRQNPVDTTDTIDNVISYIEEVKPYHVKIREYVRRLSHIDVSNLLVTDFDKPLYLDNTSGEPKYRVLDPNNLMDNMIIKSQNPWKQWNDNYLKNNYNLSKWDENWNPVRRFDIQILYDRVGCSLVEGWDTYPWNPSISYYSQGDHKVNSISWLSTNYRSPNHDPSKFVETTVDTISDRNMLVRNGTITHENVGSIVIVREDSSYWMWSGTEWYEFDAIGWDARLPQGAADRITDYYNPRFGMKPKDDPSLISGCELNGTLMFSKFRDGGWDIFEWGSTGWGSEYNDLVGYDVDVNGNTTTENVYDIKVDGHTFNSSNNEGYPEEMIPVRPYDSLIMKVFDNDQEIIRHSQNFIGDFERVKVENSNMDFVEWNKEEKKIILSGSSFNLHDPNNPSSEFFDIVKLSKVYHSVSSNDMNLGIKTFDLSGLNEEIPLGLVGKSGVRVVIENADNNNERMLAEIVWDTDAYQNEVSTWNGILKVNVIGYNNAPSNVTTIHEKWNIYPLENYNGGVVWIGNARCTYQSVDDNGDGTFTLNNVYISGNTLAGLEVSNEPEMIGGTVIDGSSGNIDNALS